MAAQPAPIPLGMQSYQRLKSGFPEVVLRNLILEKDSSGASADQVLRLQRAGLRKLVTFPAGIRGIYQMDGVLGGLTFVVAGNTLYSTNLATFTSIGSITGDTAPAKMAANFERLGIVSGGKFWTYNGSTLTQVTLPDDQSPIDVDVINSYFILTLSDGTFYWLAPGQADFSDPDPGHDADPALQFATAEGLPDGLRAVKRLRDDLYFFGAVSIEVWQPTGDAVATFSRAAGRTIERGCMARDSVVICDNTLFFVGDDGVVYRLSDVPARISSFGIEERIRKRTGAVSAFTYTADGHKFYVLRIPGQGSFAYDVATEAWSEFATLGQMTWRAIIGLDTANGPLAGDASGNLFVLDPEYALDNGVAFERMVTATIALDAHRRANPSMAIFVGCDAETGFSLRWKDALGDWSTPRPLTARPGSDILNAWRLGSTRGAYRTFEISTVANSIVRISGAIANSTRGSA